MKNKNYKKFYDFIQKNETETDFYLHGEITQEDYKWSESDVSFMDIKETINNMGESNTLNIFVNSPGGSVFETNSMVNLLKDAKRRGVTINSYITLGCSCASWLPLCANNVYIYANSVMMLHRPSSFAFGNAEDLQEEIDLLNKIQKDVMLPTYMDKVKDGVTEDDINELINKTSWLTSNEIQQYFDVVLMDEKQEEDKFTNKECSYITNCIDNYGDIPENIKKILEREENNMKKEDAKSLSDLFDDNKNTVKDTSDNKENEEVKDLTSDEENEKSNSSKEENEKSTNSGEEDKNKPEEDEETNEDSQEPEDSCKKEKKNSSDEIKELKDMIASLMPMVNEYKKNKENEALNNLSKSYKNKFEKYELNDLFESDEVQNLIKDGVNNDKSLLKLDNILLDNISINNKQSKKVVKEKASEVDNLLDAENTAKSFGFED